VSTGSLASTSRSRRRTCHAAGWSRSTARNPRQETLTLQVIAEMQKIGGTAAFIDAEKALDISYAAKLGVKTETC